MACLAAARAGVPEAPETAISTPTKEPSPWVTSFQFDANYSFVAPAEIDSREISEQNTDEEFVITSQYKEAPPLRFGAAWERFSFSSNTGTRIPNTLQSEAAIIGFDFQVGSSIFGRLEAQPGTYSGSSGIAHGCFDAPVTFGASYLYSKDLQPVLGFLVDTKRKWPLFPGGGVRWQINDQWLLNGVLPRPRLEYKINSDLSFFGGATVFGNCYRVNEDFGSDLGEKRLNSAWLDFTEIRVGAGATVKTKQVNLDVEIGYLAFREFNYHGADTSFDSGEGSFYAGLSLQAKF
jgi:hypothetical protein